VKPVSESVDIGDVVNDVGMISGVDPQSITVVTPSCQEFMAEYNAAFRRNERVEDSILKCPFNIGFSITTYKLVQ
jgi:hypothetical protein